MRIPIAFLLILMTGIMQAQITLPSYQGVLATRTVQTPPTVTTTTASSITISTASSGGNVTNAGTSTVTAKGVCWSTSTAPTVALATKTNNGTGTGVYASSITGLNSNTLYYVRAYATSAAGTSYGAEESFTTLAIAVGDLYQGGMVYYLLQSDDPGYDANVQHGLIMTTTDQSAGITWGSASSSVTGFPIGTGSANTTAIVTATGAEANAAKLCYDLVLGGYSDWYLPSADELYEMVFTKTLFPDPEPVDYYWSSTGITAVNNTNRAYAVNPSFGMSPALKGTTYKVRAVRSF